jgi:hypothetical protein
MTPQEELLALINKFLSGENRSLHLAGQIEGLVLEFFSNAPWFDLAQELAVVAEAIKA